jgi:hypothetical protein
MLPTGFRGRIIGAAVAAAAVLAVSGAATVEAQPARVQVGTLECAMSSSVGLIVASQRALNCLFKAEGVPPEAYQGTITQIGLDIGVTTGGSVIWAVFTGTNRYTGMLSGTYVGATAEMTVAVGLGANVLVGGSGRSIALQPLSVQEQRGLDIAAGVSELQLHLAQ